MYTSPFHVLSFLFAMASLTILPGIATAQNARLGNGKREMALVAQTVPPAMPGSAEALLQQAKAPLYLLDFRSLPPKSPLAVWLSEDQLFREPGAAYDPSQPRAFFSPIKLTETFDCLIFIRESHASMLLPHDVALKRQEKN